MVCGGPRCGPRLLRFPAVKAGCPAPDAVTPTEPVLLGFSSQHLQFWVLSDYWGSSSAAKGSEGMTSRKPTAWAATLAA